MGYWKFNASLLKDEEYINSLRSKLDHWGIKYKDIASKQLYWKLIKYEIRNYSIQYSKQQKKKMRNHENDLRKRQNILESHDTDNIEKEAEIESVKEILKVLDNEKLQGSIMRSRVKWVEEGEKSSKFFFDLEKHNYMRKSIRKLKTNSGETITDPEEIALYQKQFYEKLLTSQRCNKSNYSSFINDMCIPKLSETEELQCEGKISLKECSDILSTVSKNKSPGNDGLTIEFYIFFWGKIGQLLIDSYNESFDKGQLSASQKQAVITLLQKNGKDRLFTKLETHIIIKCRL